MPWQIRYPNKVATALEAIRRISPGQRIFIGSGAAEPAKLVEALVTGGDHLADNEIVHILTLGPAPYVRAGLRAALSPRRLLHRRNVREAVQEGRADFVRCSSRRCRCCSRRRRSRVAVAFVQVRPPDENGYVSLGVSVDVVRAAIDAPRSSSPR